MERKGARVNTGIRTTGSPVRTSTFWCTDNTTHLINIEEFTADGFGRMSTCYLLNGRTVCYRRRSLINTCGYTAAEFGPEYLVEY